MDITQIDTLTAKYEIEGKAQVIFDLTVAAYTLSASEQTMSTEFARISAALVRAQIDTTATLARVGCSRPDATDLIASLAAHAADDAHGADRDERFTQHIDGSLVGGEGITLAWDPETGLATYDGRPRPF